MKKYNVDVRLTIETEHDLTSEQLQFVARYMLDMQGIVSPNKVAKLMPGDIADYGFDDLKFLPPSPDTYIVTYCTGETGELRPEYAVFCEALNGRTPEQQASDFYDQLLKRTDVQTVQKTLIVDSTEPHHIDGYVTPSSPIPLLLDALSRCYIDCEMLIDGRMFAEDDVFEGLQRMIEIQVGEAGLSSEYDEIYDAIAVDFPPPNDDDEDDDDSEEDEDF